MSTGKGNTFSTPMRLDRSCVAHFVVFVRERHAIYERRTAGQPKPWATDALLLDYKFCNVYRELDTVTRWITSSWRIPYAADPDLWFAMVVARLLNRPATLDALGYPARWKGERFIKLVHRLKAEKIPAFSGAYMISTHGRSMDKAEFLATHVLTPLWKNRAYIRPLEGDTLSSFAGRLREQFGMGSFLTAQVVADVKYVAPLLDCEDWWTWASSGPGSRRGLNRICGREIGKAWREDVWLTTLDDLARVALPELADMPGIHAQDLQNCLCEFDKYERVRLDQGRMKSRYNGRI